MLIAHRGFRNQNKENRMIDFTRALKITKAVEFDIRLTKDQQVIIFHDEDFNRIGGYPVKVSALTYAEIKSLPFFLTQPLFLPPLLITDFGAQLASQYQLINVEVKVETYNPDDLIILEASLNELRKLTAAEIIVSSFSPELLRWIARLNSQFKKGYLINEISDLDLEFVKKFDYLHPSIKLLKNPTEQKIFQAIGLPLNLWTFKDDEEVQTIQALPVANLVAGYISDNPDLKIS